MTNKLLTITLGATILGGLATAKSLIPGNSCQNDIIHKLAIAGTDTFLVATSFDQALYVDDSDVVGQIPVCTGDCAEEWPPYLVTAEEVTKLPEDFATIARANGKLQVTYYGRPLYTFDTDRKPLDVLGDGDDGIFHKVTTNEE